MASHNVYGKVGQVLGIAASVLLLAGDSSGLQMSGLQNIKITLIPVKPISGDNISLKAELTYPTAGYTVKFGKASIKDKTIAFDIKTSPPPGIAAQVITTYSYVYDLGYLVEGSYTYEVRVNNVSVEKGSFEILPRSQEVTPTSAAANHPVKIPGFGMPVMIILISYTVLKIKSRGGI